MNHALPRFLHRPRQSSCAVEWVRFGNSPAINLLRFLPICYCFPVEGSVPVIVGVAKESYPGERRVALVPVVIPNLAKAGLEVVVESGAGEGAGYPDSAYVEKGGKVLPDRAAVFSAADIIVQVLCYGSNDVTGKADLPRLRRDQLLIGFLRPFGSAEVAQQIAAAGVTAFSVELVPRTTRAQSMDAPSSMGTICGYKSVLLAAETSIRIFPRSEERRVG